MKIRNRLSIVFTLVAGLILLVVSATVYYLSAVSRQSYFAGRLQERVKITEQLYLEKDNLEPDVYQGIRDKFLHTLPEEVELVEPLDQMKIGSPIAEANQLPKVFLERLLQEGYAEFESGKRQGVGQIYNRQNEQYAVVVIAVDQHGLAWSRKLRDLLVVGALLSILLVFVLSRVFAQKALKPIAKKIRKAQTIGASNLHQRLEVYNKKDELGQLAIAFNELLDRLEQAFDLQKEFVRNASHELRNPLTTILGEAEVVLERERSKEEYVASVQNIAQEAERLNELVNHFLDLTQTGFDDLENNNARLRLDEVLLVTKATMDKLHPDNKINLDFAALPEDASELIVRGNPDLIKVALTNVMDNARKFSHNEPVVVSLKVKNQQVHVAVADEGVGIKAGDLDRIFQPLFRADNARSFKGTGLGLPMVHRIMELHGGNIRVDSKLGVGTTVSLLFSQGENEF